MKTNITELLGIKYPIIQGGMQRVSTANLVAAVSNAGGLGILSALTQPTPADLAKEIARTRELTDKPFGVNITILPTITPPPYEEYAQVIVDAGITVVETAGRSPQAFMAMFNAANIKVIHKCTSVKHALKAQSIGCAAVTIDGFEAAGHPGEDDIPSLILVPRAVDALDIPVIACGGFSDGRGLVAALALGAQGVSMGTRFVATQESSVHQNMKDSLVSATELDTQLILRPFKNTARVFKNSVSTEISEIEKATDVTFNDVAPLVAGSRGATVLTTGDMEAGIWWAGMSASLIKDVPTVSELLDRIMADAEEIIESRLTSILNK